MSFLLSHCGLAGRAAAADSDHEGLDQLRSLGVVPANNTEVFGYNDIVSLSKYTLTLFYYLWESVILTDFH